MLQLATKNCLCYIIRRDKSEREKSGCGYRRTEYPVCSSAESPEDVLILMLTKADLESSDSFLAQGGICVMRDETGL